MASALLTMDAASGIAGSISIACWVVVFSPQVIENFRRSSAEGLSIVFVVIWLVGDVFNILGSVLQGVLPTMVILALYYTLADVVLLAQCFYYRGFTLRDAAATSAPRAPDPNEETSLLGRDAIHENEETRRISFPDPTGRRPSSIREHLQALDGTKMSPATPMHSGQRDVQALKAASPAQHRGVLAAVVFNMTAVLLVCAAGVVGWLLSRSTVPVDAGHAREHQDASLEINVLGQVFGYICAVLYLGSRIPQLLLNWRRKSTEGVSMLFFSFACLGNLTFVLSILFFQPVCERDACRAGEAAGIYWRYVVVNLSWLLGSLGTLALDFGVFVQFFLYQGCEQERESALVDD